MLTQRPQDRIVALVLAAIAGCVDAIAYLELGGFFVSFMSGNSTRLGLAVGSSQWALAGFAFGLIALFVGGVAMGSLIGARFGQRRAPALLAIEALLLLAAAWLYGSGHPASAPPLLAAAMGIANTVLTRVDAPGPGISFMTGTLVRIGRALGGDAGARGTPLLLDLLLWLGFIAGAAAGAIGDARYGGAALKLPAAAALLLALSRRRAA